MIRTRFTQVAGVDHPVVCAGMGGGGADGELAGRVSEAGGLGVIGASFLEADAVRDMAAHARAITSKPIGINLLLFATEDLLEAVLDVQPEVLSTAWPREDQDLSAIFARAHELEIKVMHMVPTLDDAKQAAEAGADVIVAQGTDGGGHVGEMGTTVIVRQVAKAVAPVPVLAAGGFADGAGLASALALGADGVLLGTRFVASEECPEPAWLKWRIVASDGHDTVRTTVPDTLSGRDWPGAWSRVLRTRLIEEWLGREPELRRRRQEVLARLEAMEGEEEPESWRFWIGQSAGRRRRARRRDRASDHGRGGGDPALPPAGPARMSVPKARRERVLARIRKTCLALPETSERLSHGAPTFFVRDKRAFLMVMTDHHGDGRFAIWCAAGEGVQEMLVEADTERFFVPPYVGHRGWVGMRLDRELDWDELARDRRRRIRGGRPGEAR